MTITLNGEDHLVAPRTTVTELVRALGLPHRGVAVAVDRVIVPRSMWPTEVIPVGAEVEVVTAMQGG